METQLVRVNGRREIKGVGRLGTQRRPQPGLRAAYRLSAVIAVLMVAASGAGLLIDDLYPDGPWTREALRGGDLTTLVVAVPVLVGSIVLARRGSRAAQAAWMGALAYSIYNYAYFAFGAEFNDIFVLHIALLSLSIAASVMAIVHLDKEAVAARFRHVRGTRWVAGFLTVVGTILGGLWVFLAIRFTLTGELMADIPADGIHLVFAIDTSLLVPALVISGVLLWRRSSGGFVFAPAMVVMGALYQVNLLLAGLFQANADVPGVKAFPPEGIALAAGFAVAALALFAPRVRHGAAGARDAEGRSVGSIGRTGRMG